VGAQGAGGYITAARWRGAAGNVAPAGDLDAAAGLSGKAVTNVLPAGNAAGAAVQFRMLATAGINADDAAGIVALVPITPGGLGIVEASLSGLPVLAGVSGGRAFVATLAYRLASDWLPLLVGLAAYLLFRRHYPPDATSGRKQPGTHEA
jgi:hypothetical protein